MATPAAVVDVLPPTVVSVVELVLAGAVVDSAKLGGTVVDGEAALWLLLQPAAQSSSTIPSRRIR
ncbi:MAG TPA: hypothetical protein VFR41_10875 [Acidimicrobiia bacterium]|nr:hypothetical protein [Acidimicrobiia bacterium]